MYTISYYTDNDYESMIAILKDSDLYDETWEARENLKRKITRDPESILLAIYEKEIVGCVFVMEDGWNGFIWRLCVAKEHRSKGVGKLLMQRAESIIKERGIKESSLFVNTGSTSLIKWYTGQGYTTGNNWTFMYKKLDN